VFVQITAIHHGDDAPSGEDLEYEKIFTDLILAAQSVPEQQSGDEVKPGKEPDPQEVISCAEAVLARSNDLRAAILYGNARIRTDGFAGLAELTAYVRACLEGFWDSCHPQLDADDDDDPTMRVNAVLALVDRDLTLRNLRQASLTQSAAFGRFNLRDFAMAEGEIPTPDDMDNPPTRQAVTAAMQDTPAEVHARTHDAINAALDDLKAINAVFDDRLPGLGPNLAEITVMLRKAAAIVAPHVASADIAAQDDVTGTPVGAAPAAASAAAAPPGTLSSPEDVRKALDRIIEYYAKHEPSSPLPILLHRARRLVGADFMTIIQDIAPGGLDNVRLIGGIEDE